MGGYGVRIAETENYIWWVHVQMSGGCPTYRFEVENKHTNLRCDPRTDCTDDGGLTEKEFDKAIDEMEKHRKTKTAFDKMTADNIALSEMWRRMTEAEKDARYWRQVAEEDGKAIDAMKAAFYRRDDRQEGGK